jgi:hypothetical protein
MDEEEESAAGTLKMETLLFAGRRKIPLLTLQVGHACRTATRMYLARYVHPPKPTVATTQEVSYNPKNRTRIGRRKEKLTLSMPPC